MKRKILIIEDDPVIRSELTALLKGNGYEASVITDFYNVIQEVKSIQPHLILLDIKLPMNSGFSLCSQLRSFSNVPIIFVTSCNTDMGTLTLAPNSCYEDAIGEMVYNSYTNVLYVFPDSICENLLAVMQNRYIQTEAAIPYQKAISLENAFVQKYPEMPDNGIGAQYYIRTQTSQVNDSIASSFILQATMTYSAVVLMVICLTILSLQQLLDTAHYRFRFGVLQKLGVDQRETEQLILKQLAVWFGLPIFVAIFVSTIIVSYFFEMISAQISAYIGINTLLTQVGMIICILFLLLTCYFASTWILFRKYIIYQRP